MLDLMRDYDSYLFGFLLADGSLNLYTRNRGKVQIEISHKDKDIIEKIYENFPYKSTITSRVRVTNFKSEYKSVIWRCNLLEFREQLLKLGFPKQDKSNIANTPNKEYIKPAFWRGYIDGDGSIGITKNNEPFVSVTITSEELVQKYLNFLKQNFGVTKILNPNKRDNVYNITVKNEDAISLCNYLYKDSTIHLDRKYKKYLDCLDWKRSKKKVNSRAWTSEEDLFILNNSVANSMTSLDRTDKSIQMRLWRLKQNNNKPI